MATVSLTASTVASLADPSASLITRWSPLLSAVQSGLAGARMVVRVEVAAVVLPVLLAMAVLSSPKLVPALVMVDCSVSRMAS